MDNKFYSIEKLKKKDFSLILSGGSALGFAHLGTLRFLEENKITPKEIIGVSMGAIVGSLYAIGYSYNNIYSLIEDLNLNKFIKFNKKGIIFNIEYIYDLLEKAFEEKTFKDTKIDLKIIATNTKNAHATIFSKENNIKIIDALKASFAIPGIFEPIEIKNNLYFDGFVGSNLPIEFSKYKTKLAINVINKKSLYKVEHKKGFFSYFQNQIKYLKNLLDYMIINQNDLKIRQEKDLFLIEPNLSIFKKSEFKKWKEIEIIGYKEIYKKFK